MCAVFVCSVYFMARTILLIVLSFLIVLSYGSGTHVQSAKEGLISIDVSNKGLDFTKDVLVKETVSSLVSLRLPQIEKPIKIPLLGKVFIVLSNITICRVDVASSEVQPGEDTISIVASGSTADLSMQWRYSYSSWFSPIAISDNGSAAVRVEGIEVGLSLSLQNQNGTLKLSLLKCGCHVGNISIKLDGGASWLYQGVVDAFEREIGSTFEDVVSQKIRDGIIKIDRLLQSLPKEFPIDDIATVNVTIVNDSVLSSSFVNLQLDGSFTAKDQVAVFDHRNKYFEASVPCKKPEKMVGISFHENVLNSASLAYFNADTMQWTIDKIPDQHLLNTAEWKFIIPQLYKQYPNDDLILNVSVSSPPILKIEDGNVDATIHSDVTIDVLHSGDVIPVACLSLVVKASGSAKISRSTLAASVKLKDFTMSLEWSTIGKLQVHLVQKLISTVLKTVVLPYMNLKLARGLHLPHFHGYTLRHAVILFADSKAVICCDIAFLKQDGLGQLQMYY